VFGFPPEKYNVISPFVPVKYVSGHETELNHDWFGSEVAVGFPQ